MSVLIKKVEVSPNPAKVKEAIHLSVTFSIHGYLGKVTNGQLMKLTHGELLGAKGGDAT